MSVVRFFGVYRLPNHNITIILTSNSRSHEQQAIFNF